MRRRALLQSLGSAAVLASVGVAGCVGSSDAQSSVFDREAPAPTSVGDGWRSPRKDVQNTGHAGVPGPGNAPGVAWRETFEDARFRHEPVAFEETVLVPSTRDSRLLALDIADASVRWEEQLDRGSGPVTVHDDTVLCPDGHELRAFRRGNAEWSESLSGEVTGVTAVDGTAYVATADGSPALHALSVDNGGLEWRRETGLLESTPAVADGTVLVGDMDGVVRAFDADTGDEQWRHRVRDHWLQADVVVDGRTVYAAFGTGKLDRGTVYALDLEGEERWRRELERAVVAPFALGGGRLFVVDADGTLRALDATDGRQQWEFAPGGDATAPLSFGQHRYAPTVCNGLVHCVGPDERLRALETDADSADVRWSAAGDFTTSPAVAGEYLLVGVRDEFLALGPSTS